MSFLRKEVLVQLVAISTGVKGKEEISHFPWSGRQKAPALFNPTFMGFIMIANMKEVRHSLPGLSGDKCGPCQGVATTCCVQVD